MKQLYISFSEIKNIKAAPEDGPHATQSNPVSIPLFSYQHVVCFDLLYSSRLQEREGKGNRCNSYADDDHAGDRDAEVALNKSERTHEGGHVRICAIVRSDRENDY